MALLPSVLVRNTIADNTICDANSKYILLESSFNTAFKCRDACISKGDEESISFIAAQRLGNECRCFETCKILHFET